jgi:predicted flap endonuclease-1-like 5' DNA nuclease
MNKLLRLLLTLGAIAGILWLLRDKIVPPPQPPVAHPPSFRSPPPPEPTPADNLERLRGIGPVYKARLADLGITTFAALAQAERSTIAAALELGDEQVAELIAQARDLA